jgi:tRNA A37 N6-isopentenylltransferase MiaA
LAWRTDTTFEHGLVDEVAALLGRGDPPEVPRLCL